MTRVLATFCNQDCARLAVVDPSGVIHCQTLPSGRIPANVRGISGGAVQGDKFIAALQCATPALVVCSRDLEPELVIPMPCCDDLHGLAPVRDAVLVISTGTNEVYRVEVAAEPRISLFWSETDDRGDTVHLNDIAVGPEGIVFSAFGRRRANQMRCGQVFKVHPREVILEGLREPHSPQWSKGDLFVLESGSGDLVRLTPGAHPERLFTIRGYTRGLLVSQTHFVVGVSGYRHRSRNVGLGEGRTRPFDPLTPLAEDVSGLVFLPRTAQGRVAAEGASFVDTSNIGPEIYAVVPW